MCTATVYLVDDEPAFNFLTKRLLMKHSIFTEIKAFPDGENAWNSINKNTLPDIILLDIRMPVMDGFEFLKEFHKTFSNSKTKIFMLTSSIRKEDRTMAMQFENVIDYFEKPLDKDKVSKIIELLSDGLSESEV